MECQEFKNIENKIRYIHAQMKHTFSNDQLEIVVFNELLMSEYKHVVTLDTIQQYMCEHPNVYANGFGMTELLTTERYDIADYLYLNNRCNSAGTSIYEMSRPV